MKYKIFIILSTNNIGGAEMRFFGLWKHANKEKSKDFDFYFVCNSKLYAALLLKEKTLNSENKANIIQYDFSGDYKTFNKKVFEFRKEYVGVNDILHFVDGYPLMKINSKNIFSITQSSLKNLNIKGKLIQFFGALSADVVDVLDPKIYSILKTIYLFKRRNIFITSNSFCDTEKFLMTEFSEKKDWFVFLGRFEKLKQVDRLIEMLPSIYEILKETYKNDLKFIFLGYGSMENMLKEKIMEEKYKDIPIVIEHVTNPEKIVKQSKFFFSVQLNNNYPSRSLIEAMCAGTIPICTNVGQTKWLAKPEFSFYVPENFTQEDFKKVFNEITNLSNKDIEAKSLLANQMVLKEHTIEKMFEYYLDKYKHLIN